MSVILSIWRADGMPVMKIVIPDDYQDVVHRLASFTLIAGHGVTRYREPAENFDQLVERLCEAEVIVAIRERVNFSRALLERLPRLKLLALVGRTSKLIDLTACMKMLDAALAKR